VRKMPENLGEALYRESRAMGWKGSDPGPRDLFGQIMTTGGAGMTVQQELWDREQAEKYARWMKVGARIAYAPFARKIVKHLPPIERESVIADLGTGPGLLSIELCKLMPEARIIGVDPSSGVLEIARRNAGEAGISNYETRLGSAEEMPIDSDSLVLVVTQSSLHEWDDQQRAFSEIFRVLKPGGSVMLKDYNRDWLSEWKRTLLHFFHHLELFRYSFDDVADMLREAGFGEISGERGGLQFFVRAVKPRSTLEEPPGRTPAAWEAPQQPLKPQD
jgi:SAM-dependent methyltransferase